MIVRLATIVILAAAVAVGYLAYRLDHEPLPALAVASDGAAPDAGASAPAAPARPAHPELRDYPNLADRPPFSPDRIPFVADSPESDGSAAGDSASSVAESLRARLLGVISEGDERFAILAPAGGAQAEILRRGGRIEGWEVEKIDDKLIVLRKGATTVEILLFEDR